MTQNTEWKQIQFNYNNTKLVATMIKIVLTQHFKFLKENLPLFLIGVKAKIYKCSLKPKLDNR